MELKTSHAELYDYLKKLSIYDIRNIARAKGAATPTTGKKEEIIDRIVRVCAGVDAPIDVSNSSGKGAPPKSTAKQEHLEAISKIMDYIDSKSIIVVPQRDTDKIIFADSGESEKADYEKDFVSGLVDFVAGKYYLALNNYGTDYEFELPIELIKEYSLRVGDKVVAIYEETGEGPKIEKITGVNFTSPEQCGKRINFNDALPCFTNEKIDFSQFDKSFLALDMINPIGKGQRALITAPPASGKTMLVNGMVNSLASGSPVAIVLLLVGARPEELSLYKNYISAIELFATTFDDSAKKQVKVATLAFEHAKRLMENKQDVIIFVDGVVDLAYAFAELNQNNVSTSEIKKLFAIAKNTENSGSITVVATIREEQDVGALSVYRELKRTASVELVLSKKFCDRRIFPPFDFTNSYNYSLDKLLSNKEIEAVGIIKNQLKQTDDLLSLYEQAQDCSSAVELVEKFAR